MYYGATIDVMRSVDISTLNAYFVDIFRRKFMKAKNLNASSVKTRNLIRDTFAELLYEKEKILTRSQ